MIHHLKWYKLPIKNGSKITNLNWCKISSINPATAANLTKKNCIKSVMGMFCWKFLKQFERLQPSTLVILKTCFPRVTQSPTLETQNLCIHVSFKCKCSQIVFNSHEYAVVPPFLIHLYIYIYIYTIYIKSYNLYYIPCISTSVCVRPSVGYVRTMNSTLNSTWLPWLLKRSEASPVNWWFGARWVWDLGIPLRSPIPFIFGDPIGIRTTGPQTTN